MKWLRKMRPVIFALGLTLGIATLIGARSLTGGTGSDGSGRPGDAAPRSATGPVVLGTVDTDPPPVDYRLPPVLPSGTVVKVHVKDGDEVKAGQELYEFDSTMQQKDVKRAEATVEYAKTKVKEAEELVKQHTNSIKSAEIGVDAAKRKVEVTLRTHTYIDRKLEETYKANREPPDTWAELKKSSLDLIKASADYYAALGEQDVAKARLDQLNKADPTVKTKEAEAAVEQAKAELAKAQSAVEMCVVKAKSAGTVEQVTISAGTTMGVATRAPALWLIPNGPRVVRAEIEAEFAHRVGPDIVGKTVTITDHTDPKLTYSGTVRRVPNVYLLKRASAENFLGGDTRVLEAVIEVSDPAPANKPPLRIGQRVRVNLGQ
jgi:membrane fusion protein, multidrug efflux system